MHIDQPNIVRVALAQINSTVGDFDGNASKILSNIEMAKKAGADIVTFPELALCGYPPEDLLLKPKFLQDNINTLKKIVCSVKDIVAIVGFADFFDGKTFNSAAVIKDKHLVGIYHKVELPNYGVFDEKRYFIPGGGQLIFEINGVRSAVNICEDIWIRGSIVEHYTIVNGAKIVFNISSSPFHAGKLNIRKDVISEFARRTHTYVCYNNLIGGQDELVFDGGSMIVSPNGDVIASARRFEEDLLVADIDMSLAPQIAVGLKELSEEGNLQTGSKETSGPEDIAEIYDALVVGTRDYVRKNRFNKVVLGLSGGIDSSLVAVIAVDALGRDNVIGVTMPSMFTSNETRSDAQKLSENLGIRLLVIPIDPIFRAYVDTLNPVFNNNSPGVEMENIQARIRGNILMALSNKFGWLVLTTGNKSEMAVGYCTLYGDMAGGFAVIKDVPKTLVYKLAEYVNRRGEIIPGTVIRRAPTAELRFNQKDEDSIPPYSILDPIIKAYVEEDKSFDEIVKLGFPPDIVREVVRMVDGNEYKRRQAPPGVKITPKAFGRDRRLPITSRYIDHQK